MQQVKNYLSLVKFSHTIFALPFAFIGFFLGAKYWNGIRTGQTDLTLNTAQLPADLTALGTRFILVMVCMFTARNAAMAFNRYLDRHFDASNPRTAIREIPKGIISPNNALRFVIINCIVFVGATYFINSICFYLSPVALFVILFYSYTKRFTPLCHVVLGIGLSLAPIGAYLAITGAFSLLPLLFSIAVIFWVSGFDIIYSLQDEEFDVSQKLYSMPGWLGKAKALHVAKLLHVISAASVIAAGFYGNFYVLYWLGVAVFAGMLLYQHSIVKPNDLRRVNVAFMTANGMASVVFAVFVIADIFVF